MMFESDLTSVGGLLVLVLLSLGCSQNEATKTSPQAHDSDRTTQIPDVAVSTPVERPERLGDHAAQVREVAASKDLQRAVLDVFEKVELEVPAAKRNPFGLERNADLLKHGDPKERAMAAYRLALLDDPGVSSRPSRPWTTRIPKCDGGRP